MGVSTKVLRKAAIKLDSGTYTAPDTLFPFTSLELKQSFTPMEDNGIVGVAFKDLPVQGNRKLEGSFEYDVESLVSAVLFEAAMGNATAKVYNPPITANAKSLSIFALDEVKSNLFGGVHINNMMLKSEADGFLKMSGDLVSSVLEVRDATAFPAISVNPGTKFAHKHLSGSGYIRIADQADALAAGDNKTDIKSVSMGLNWNTTLDYANSATALTPLSAQGEASFEFEVAEHSADTYHAARDARTVMQAELLYYASATAQLKIQVSNFIITEVTPSADDKTKLAVKCVCGRNGMGTSYSNASMAFVWPLLITLTNS